MFPRAGVSVTPGADYRYRALVPRAIVAKAIASQAEKIDYTIFKNSVHDVDRHMAYSRVWQEMFYWQNPEQKTPPKPARRPLARLWKRRRLYALSLRSFGYTPERCTGIEVKPLRELYQFHHKPHSTLEMNL